MMQGDPPISDELGMIVLKEGGGILISPREYEKLLEFRRQQAEVSARRRKIGLDGKITPRRTA